VQLVYPFTTIMTHFILEQAHTDKTFGVMRVVLLLLCSYLIRLPILYTVSISPLNFNEVERLFIGCHQTQLDLLLIQWNINDA